MSQPKPGASSAPAEEDEDDYMNMTFEDPTPAKETSFQRTQRLKRESRARGVVKSKAQLAEEEEAAREKALSTSLLDSASAKKSKGLAMMAKMGFAGGGLGKKAEGGEAPGRTEPIPINKKDDRGGIGLDSERKRKLREAAEEHAVKVAKLDPDEYRERVRRERLEAKLEKQLHAAQRLAERLDDGHSEDKDSLSGDEDDNDDASDSSPPPRKPKTPAMAARPLKSIPVLYRGLIRHREEKERDRKMRADLEQSLSRLPAYESGSDEEDDADRMALGKTKTAYVVAEDLDEEDEELDAFNALDVGERLAKLLAYLRDKHRYCFWCKMAYPDKEMDGCPGVTEEDHD